MAWRGGTSARKIQTCTSGPVMRLWLGRPRHGGCRSPRCSSPGSMGGGPEVLRESLHPAPLPHHESPRRPALRGGGSVAGRSRPPETPRATVQPRTPRATPCEVTPSRPRQALQPNPQKPRRRRHPEQRGVFFAHGPPTRPMVGVDGERRVGRLTGPAGPPCFFPPPGEAMPQQKQTPIAADRPGDATLTWRQLATTQSGHPVAGPCGDGPAAVGRTRERRGQ